MVGFAASVVPVVIQLVLAVRAAPHAVSEPPGCVRPWKWKRCAALFAEVPPACLCPSADTACAAIEPARLVPRSTLADAPCAAGVNAPPGLSGRDGRSAASSDRTSVG